MLKKVILIILIILALGAGGFVYVQSQRNRDWSFNYDPGDKFVTDIADSDRMLSADLIIRMTDSRQAEYLVENNQRIRNTVIFTLRTKTRDELKSGSIESNLNEEILSRLNDEFDSDMFEKIYFNEFVVH